MSVCSFCGFGCTIESDAFRNSRYDVKYSKSNKDLWNISGWCWVVNAEEAPFNFQKQVIVWQRSLFFIATLNRILGCFSLRWERRTEFLE